MEHQEQQDREVKVYDAHLIKWAGSSLNPISICSGFR